MPPPPPVYEYMAYFTLNAAVEHRVLHEQISLYLPSYYLMIGSGCIGEQHRQSFMLSALRPDNDQAFYACASHLKAFFQLSTVAVVAQPSVELTVI